MYFEHLYSPAELETGDNGIVGLVNRDHHQSSPTPGHMSNHTFILNTQSQTLVFETTISIEDDSDCVQPSD